MGGAASIALWLALGQTTAQAPPDFRAVVERGLHALAAGQFDAAEAALREAQRLHPRNPLVPFHLAQIHVQRREFGLAIASFRQAIALNPDEPQVYLGLAVLYTQLERFHDAQETLNQLLRISPDNSHAYFLLGRVAEEQGEHALAEQHLRHYVRLKPGDAKGLAELGVALLAQEKFPEAEPLLQEALAQNPNLGNARYNLGVLYSRRGEDPQAKTHLEAATRLLPENAQAYYELGTVLVRLDELANAETAFRKALELAPDYAEAHYALGTLLRRLGRAEEATQALAEHERLSTAALEDRQRSRRVTAYHLDVKGLLEQDRLEEAEAKLGEILAIDPQNDLAYYRRAQIAFLRHEDDRALEDVRAALHRKEFEPAYYMLEAMCLERLGREEEAARAYERLLSLADYADAYVALARLELRRGETAQAVTLLRRAVALEPENPDLRLALAEALERAGDHVESQKQRAEAEALRSKLNPR